MSTIHKAGRVVLSGFGIAWVAALALVSGCASEDISATSAQSDDVSGGEATEAITQQGKYACMNGQLPGTLEVNFNPDGPPFCVINNFRTGGSSHKYCVGTFPNEICPGCRDLGDETLGCRY